jgi:hypothetical protein
MKVFDYLAKKVEYGCRKIGPLLCPMVGIDLFAYFKFDLTKSEDVVEQVTKFPWDPPNSFTRCENINKFVTVLTLWLMVGQ